MVAKYIKFWFSQWTVFLTVHLFFHSFQKILYIRNMNKNSPYIKTKLLKRLRRKARKRYKFEEVYTRNEQKQSVPLYQVLDMTYDYDDCYRVQKETTNKEEAWSFYLSKYREVIFEALDDYYRMCNKKPKSIRKKQKTNSVNSIGMLRPVLEFVINENESNKQIPNKIKII